MTALRHETSSACLPAGQPIRSERVTDPAAARRTTGDPRSGNQQADGRVSNHPVGGASSLMCPYAARRVRGLSAAETIGYGECRCAGKSGRQRNTAAFDRGG
jgi:hypothetical protein